MPFRFIVLLPNPTLAEDLHPNRITQSLLSRDRDWQVRQCGSLTVLWQQAVSPSWQVHLLPDNRGVVLGTLFRRDRSSPELAKSPLGKLSEAEGERIVHTAGRALLSDFWGRYAAVIMGDPDRAWILRDPSGALTVFHTSIAGTDLVFSDPNEIENLEGARTEINWPYLARRLVHNRIQNRDTGLCHVQQLNAGECLEIAGRHRSTSLYWNPTLFAASDSLEDPARAADELRATISGCVASWAKCYPAVIHRLSGGLDSSIVLSCLSRCEPKPDILCVNHITPTREGDEVRYAREAAALAECPLLEGPRDPTQVRLDQAILSHRSVSPPLWLAEIEVDQREQALACSRPGSAFFGGRGGDIVLYAGRSEVILTDYLQRHAVTARLPQILRHAAMISRKSIWQVGAAALAGGAAHEPADLLLEKLKGAHFVPDSLLESLKGGTAHPWAAIDDSVPPGKAAHVRSLIDIQNYYGSEDWSDYVYPLTSQPVVELCLRIPTYVLCVNGHDRGLARLAFQGWVAETILRRTSKGGTDAYLAQVILGNLVYLREFLMEGVLSQHRLIDRHKLSLSLDETALIRDAGHARLLAECFGVEAWARTWESSQRRGVSREPRIAH